MKIIGFILILGFIFFLKSIDNLFGSIGLFLAIIIPISLLLFFGIKSNKERENLIKNKYTEDIAIKILSGKYWIGQSKEQLRDSIGLPEKIEFQENTKHTKEVWKFFHKNSNRIRTKITIINGIVSQIDEK